MKHFKICDVNNYISVKNDIAILNVYGDIVASEYDKWSDEDVCPNFVSKFLANVKGKELHIHINSGGGSAFAGIAIYNLIKARNEKTIVHIDALAASAASIIAMAGDEIRMPVGSQLLIHKPWAMVVGNAEELRHEAEFLDSVYESLLEIYKENLVSDDVFETVKKYVDAETCLNGEAAAKLFSGIVVENNLQACACADSESYSRYHNLPKNLKFTEKDVLKKSELQAKSSEIDNLIKTIEITEML